jgi:hypothetical protein
MRTRLVLAAVVGSMVAIAPLGALAGDKRQSNMVNPGAVSGFGNSVLAGPIGVTFTNNVSKGKTKGDDKCVQQVQLIGLTGLLDSNPLAAGDEVICIVESGVKPGPGAPIIQGAVLRGEVKSAKVKIKADLSLEGVGCVPEPGGSDVRIFDARITCYEPDGSYAPFLAPVFASDPTQGIALGGAPRPTTPMIATEGIHMN